LFVFALLLSVTMAIQPWGHRGSSAYFPENTIPAFTAALEEYSHFELDVQITSDGYVAVIHDRTVDRTTNGTGNINNLPWAGYVSFLDAGSWKGPEFAGTHVPLLQDALNLVRENTVYKNRMVVIDTKWITPSILQPMWSIFKSYTMQEQSRFYIGCWDIPCLQEAQMYFPMTVPRALIRDSLPPAVQWTQFKELGVSMFHLNQNAITSQFVTDAHNAGFQVNCWTVNTVEDIEANAAKGVDHIMGDYPTRIVAVTGPALVSDFGINDTQIPESYASYVTSKCLEIQRRQFSFSSSDKFFLDSEACGELAKCSEINSPDDAMAQNCRAAAERFVIETKQGLVMGTD